MLANIAPPTKEELICRRKFAKIGFDAEIFLRVKNMFFDDATPEMASLQNSTQSIRREPRGNFSKTQSDLDETWEQLDEHSLTI